MAVAKQLTIAGLKMQLREAELKNESNVDAMMAEQQRLGEVVRKYQNDVKAYEAENNNLRDKLFALALEAEKMRGYIEGQRDLEPSRMVPEVKEQRHFAPNWQAHNMPGQPGQQRDKRWYHK